MECFSFCLYIENAADNIPFLRSEMKQTFAGFPGNAVLGVFKVKNNGAIFYYDRTGAPAQEAFQCAGQSLRGHGRSFAGLALFVCDG